MTSSFPCDKDKSLWRHRREILPQVDIPPQKVAKFNLYCTTNNVAQKETLASIFSTVCGRVVDHYHIGVEIHQITQTHKKVNKIHLKKKKRHKEEPHRPLWLHFYSDSDSLIWSIYLTQNIGISSITSWQGELHTALMYSNVKLQIRDE